jgi:hypothetical protein
MWDESQMLEPNNPRHNICRGNKSCYGKNGEYEIYFALRYNFPQYTLALLKANRELICL